MICSDVPKPVKMNTTAELEREAAAAGVRRAGKLVKLVELWTPQAFWVAREGCSATAARQLEPAASFFLTQVIASQRIASQHDAAKHSEHRASAYCRSHRETSDNELRDEHDD